MRPRARRREPDDRRRSAAALALALGLGLALVGVLWAGPARPARGGGPARREPERSTEAVAERAVLASARAPGVREGPLPRSFRLAETSASPAESARDLGPRGGPRGRTASLAVRLHHDERPVAGARLTLVAGLNRGRELALAPDGLFRLEDLLPGFLRLAVTSPAGSCERELALRPHVPTQLVLDLARGRAVPGTVTDESGTPLPGATVRVDGAGTSTDEAGRFRGRTQASGRAWIEVALEGYATSRIDRIPVPEQRPRPVQVVLRPACRLEVELSRPPAGPLPAQVLLIPGAERSSPGTGGTYPWSRLEPRPAPGARASFEGLPPGEVCVLVLHPVAAGRGRIHLRPGRENRLEIEMQARPQWSGRLHDAGTRLAGAAVVLEPMDPVRALGMALGEHVVELYRRPLEALPVVPELARTKVSGAFVLHPWDAGHAGQLLRVTDPRSGRVHLVRLDLEKDTDVDLAGR